MNEVLDYIEANLADEIDFDEISKIACCSSGMFQRMFSKIIGISLSEYIRRRKLSIAALELKSGNTKVIDLAFKYGYESADAFTIAFKRLHGITPASVKNPDMKIKLYPRLNFSISIKGDIGMDYKIIERESFKVIGKSIETKEMSPDISKMWGDIWQDGTGDKLCSLAPDMPMLGICYDVKDDETMKYMIGVECSTFDTELIELVIPKSTWAVFESIGPMPTAIQEVTKHIFSDFFPQGVYKHTGAPELEVYPDGDIQSQDYRCEVWVPVVKV